MVFEQRVPGYVVVALPFPLGHVRVRARRRGVRHPHVGHHARPFAHPLRPPHAGLRLVAGIGAGHTVTHGHGAGHADGLDVALHARQVRCGRARRVGHLTVHAISLKRIDIK